MAIKISEECINCGACQSECPNTAIYASGEEYELNGKTQPPLSSDYYYVVPEKCTECVGSHPSSKCAEVCPVDACQPDPSHSESKDQLLEKWKKLHPGETPKV